MAKDEELNKWTNSTTPRRAIQNFFDNATPVDSPDLDNMLDLPENCVSSKEVTPVAGNSESIQRSRVRKRKLLYDEEQPQGNVSKKNNVDETQTGSLPNDSIFGTSEFPSRLESPSLVIPPRPNQRNKKQISVTAYANAIQSQQSHMVNTSDDLVESSIPSVLVSPSEVTQRILRSKKYTSITTFKEPLGGKTTQEVTALSAVEESGLESSGIPSNLQSPKYVSSRNRSIHKSKSRVSTTTFKTMLKNQQEQDSEEIPSSLDSPEKVQQVDRFVSKSKTRMSTTAFLNVLENQRHEEKEGLTDVNFPDLQPDLQQLPDFQLKNQSSRMSKGSSILPEINSSSVANVSTLRSKRSSKSGFEDTSLEKTDLGVSGSQQTSMTIGPRRSIRLNANSKLTKTSFETSSKASDFEMSQKSSMPELESPNEFSPVTSPIQITKSKQSKPLHSTVAPRNEIFNRPSDQSQTGKSISATPPISSQLDSPKEYKEYNRPGPVYTQRTSNKVNEEMDEVAMTNSCPSSRESSNSSSSSKASKRRSKIPSPAESNAEKLASPIISKIKQSLRSATQISVVLPASSKSSGGTTRRSKSETEPENSLSKQITEPTSTKTPSSVIAAVDEAKSCSSLSSPGSRTRKSLKYGSSTTKEASSAIQTIVDNQPSTNEDEGEETSPSDSNSSNKESLEEEKSTDEIEEEEEIEELSAKSRRSTHSSRASSKSSRKSEKNGMSPSNRYPDLKNSTVVAGGAAFSGVPFIMSPIRPGEQGAPLLVLSTPKSSASKSSKAGGTVTSTNVKSLTPKTVKETTHPSTPAPSTKKRTRLTPQSPMFMDVMKSSMKKAIGNIAQNQQRVISAAPTSSPVSTTQNVSSSKGLSISNPRKGKSLVWPVLEKIPESSDSEWEDEWEQEQVKPRCINIALEEILEDRSKDFVPLEKRLLADPVFQAKVKTQRAKVAAQKAAEEAAAAAKKNETKKKPRTVAARKNEEDNIANVATNKGNLRFYARTNVTKEALDAVHGFVGEWLDFTLEQMENFCIDEGKPSLDSWEDCCKMMRRQGIVKNYMEYSGLCHELLLNDECAQLLPTSFPPEYYTWKREAKRQKK